MNAMIGAIAAALAGEGRTIIVAAVPIDGTIAAIRAADAAVILVLAGADLDPVDRAMLLAAIGPLALAKAPAARLCALGVADAARADDVIAAGRFLAGAGSTTGQVMAIGG